MKIKNKKGFTLPELLAAVVIIGILSTIAVVSVNNVMKKSHKEYDIKQNKLFTTAAQTYFTDNRSKLPRKLLTEKEVTLSELIKENYIEEIVDYKKELYNQEESKAYVKKMGRGKYSYYSKLVGSDGRVISDKEASKKSGDINVSINDYNIRETDMPRTISKDIYYVNKILKIDISGRSTGEGISSYQYKIERLKNERDKIGKKYKSSGEIEVDNKAFTDTITINAKDFANGVYKLVVYAYDYEGATSNSKESKIIVIDKTKPKCTIKMSRAPDGLEVENAKPANKWYKAGDLKALMKIKESNKYKYAIGLDEQTTNIIYDKNNTKDKEEYPIENNVVGKYVYGYIQDKAGNIGKCQTDKPVYYDQTNPSCTISLDPDRPDGQNGWYTKDVKLSMTSEDTSQNPNESGVGVQELTPDNIRSFPIQVPPLYTNTIEAIQGETKVKTWYGHVRDKAGNEATCDTGERVKVDKTPPTCTTRITGGDEGKIDGEKTGWYTSEVEVTGICSDGTSQCHNDSRVQIKTEGPNVSAAPGEVCDNAGHCSECGPIEVKIDREAPKCVQNLESPYIAEGTRGDNGWYTSDTKAWVDCEDQPGKSGCSGYRMVTVTGASENVNNKVYHRDKKREINAQGYSYLGWKAIDNAGNISDNTCIQEIKIDQTRPVVNIHHSPGSRTVTASCSDDESGLQILKEDVGQYDNNLSQTKKNRESTCIRITASSRPDNNIAVNGNQAGIKYFDCTIDPHKQTHFKCKNGAGLEKSDFKKIHCICKKDSNEIASCNDE